MSFSADITRFVQKTGLSASTVLRKVSLDAYAGLLLRSPVDTGRFRGNWRIGVNAPDLSTSDAPSRTPEGGAAPSGDELAKAARSLAAVRFGDTIHITNNLPYAKPLEEGHSKQAPTGIVGPTFQELTARFEAAVRAVRAG